MKILIIKLSSLGDVVHILPALTDAKKVHPRAEFHFVVEENFAAIPAWHPAVTHVIPVALRRWKKTFFKSLVSREFWSFIKHLRKERYDLVIDAQGLIKSAIIGLLSRGKHVGFDQASAREWLATLLYQQKFSVSPSQHAICALRALFAKALSYEVPQDKPDSAIQQHFQKVPQSKPYVVFLHGTTWPNKLWIESHWQALAALVLKQGYGIRLLSGNETELARAKRIAAISENIQVLNLPTLSDIAKLLTNAQWVVAVDTGLLHLAAALDVPSVSLYGPTDPKKTGSVGKQQVYLTSTLYCSPCLSKICTHPLRHEKPFPPCMREMVPDQVINCLGHGWR